LVQLHIAPQNPKTPQTGLIISLRSLILSFPFFLCALLQFGFLLLL